MTETEEEVTVFKLLNYNHVFYCSIPLPLVLRLDGSEERLIGMCPPYSSSIGEDGISGEVSAQVPIIARWIASSHLCIRLREREILLIHSYG